MEEEKMFYKTDFISNDKEEKDKLEQKSWLRGNKTNTKYKLFGIKKKQSLESVRQVC